MSHSGTPGFSVTATHIFTPTSDDISTRDVRVCETPELLQDPAEKVGKPPPPPNHGLVMQQTQNANEDWS